MFWPAALSGLCLLHLAAASSPDDAGERHTERDIGLNQAEYAAKYGLHGRRRRDLPSRSDFLAANAAPSLRRKRETDEPSDMVRVLRSAHDEPAWDWERRRRSARPGQSAASFIAQHGVPDRRRKRQTLAEYLADEGYQTGSSIFRRKRWASDGDWLAHFMGTDTANSDTESSAKKRTTRGAKKDKKQAKKAAKKLRKSRRRKGRKGKHMRKLAKEPDVPVDPTESHRQLALKLVRTDNVVPKPAED